MKTLKQANITKDTKVFVAADIDVPLNKQTNEIEETFRLDHLLPTLKYIITKGGFPIIGGHMGQPHGKQNENQSTKHLLSYFNKNLGKNNFELLENLRFDIREEQNDQEYAKKLAKKANIYVNENFSTSHRGHASIVSVPKYLPAFAGIQLEKEILELSTILKEPQKPLITIIGGAKIESKKPVINKFLKIADYVLVGGKIGLDWQENVPTNLILPIDYAQENKDIGSKTINKFSELIQNAKTVLWAGPLGMWENPDFVKGTKQIAEIIANSNAKWISGGGDTIAALRYINKIDKVDFVSTGGGAMLKFLTDETLIGLEALVKKS